MSGQPDGRPNVQLDPKANVGTGEQWVSRADVVIITERIACLARGEKLSSASQPNTDYLVARTIDIDIVHSHLVDRLGEKSQMTTKQTKAPPATPDTGPKRSTDGSVWAWLFAVLGVSAVLAIAWNARDYPDARVGNPQVSGAPRPVPPLLGFQHWLTVLQAFTIIAMVGIVVAFVWGWRRYRPILSC